MREDDIEYIVRRMNDANLSDKYHIEPDIVDELSEEEGIEIYNEILNIFNKHNLSFKCACNISIALMYAMVTGAAELHDNED